MKKNNKKVEPAKEVLIPVEVVAEVVKPKSKKKQYKKRHTPKVEEVQAVVEVKESDVIVDECEQCDCKEVKKQNAFIRFWNWLNR